MPEVAGRRMAAEIDGDFVVFLIGARFNNKLRLLRSMLDVGGRRGMKRMLDYLVAHPEKGLLAYEMGPVIVQYWRSFDHLEAFANDASDPHVAAWRNYWAPGRQERSDRDLARDVQRTGRGIRGGVRQHATLRARQSRSAGFPVGLFDRPPAARDGRSARPDVGH